MNTNYSSIEDEYKELADYLNEVYYSDGKSSIQEHLFQLGLDFCIDRPKFYTECESFWNYYVRQFYDQIHYIINTPMIKDRDGKANKLWRTYNLSLELPDSIREDIFIEYQTKIDQRLKPKSKTIQVGAKNKKVYLKEI
jgi:hypothetical protein